MSPKDPILLHPADTDEACLRIQEAMPGAKAEGKVITNVLDKLDYRSRTAEDPIRLFSFRHHQVDVSSFYDKVSHWPDGTEKLPGRVTHKRDLEEGTFGAIEVAWDADGPPPEGWLKVTPDPVVDLDSAWARTEKPPVFTPEPEKKLTFRERLRVFLFG